MKLIDRKFIRKPFRYIIQSLLAGGSIFLILFFINLLKHPAIIASLGATAFIIFTRPKGNSSDIRRIFGGYFIGLITGLVIYSMNGNLSVMLNFFLKNNIHKPFLGAIGVFLSIFLMTITDTEHPPAAGITLGLIIGEWDKSTLIYIVVSLIVMYSLKNFLKEWMIDLI